MRELAAGVLLILAVGVGPAAAQSPVSLRSAMLYGTVHDTSPTAPAHTFASDNTSSPTARAVLPDTLVHDPWLGRDKVLHAAGSFLLTLSAQYVLTSKLDASEDGALPIAAGATLSLGLAKEVADSRRPVRPFFSTRDLVADAVGVALAVGLILL